MRLHVKVDPEETANWLIPEKGKTNDLFFSGDEQVVPQSRRRIDPIKERDFEDDEISDGYVPYFNYFSVSRINFVSKPLGSPVPIVQLLTNHIYP